MCGSLSECLKYRQQYTAAADFGLHGDLGDHLSKAWAPFEHITKETLRLLQVTLVLEHPGQALHAGEGDGVGIPQLGLPSVQALSIQVFVSFFSLKEKVTTVPALMTMNQVPQPHCYELAGTNNQEKCMDKHGNNKLSISITASVMYECVNWAHKKLSYC